MNLIVDALLSEPPSESLYFRYVTLVACEQLHLDCLVEVEQTMKDTYYKYLLKQGLMDYVEQLVLPEEKVTGLHLGSNVTIAPAIQLKYIRADNCINLIGMIRGCLYGLD